MMTVENNIEVVSLHLARQKAMQTQIAQVHQSTIYGINLPWVTKELCADQHIIAIREQSEFISAMRNPAAKYLLILQSAQISLSMVEAALKAQPQNRTVFMELV